MPTEQDHRYRFLHQTYFTRKKKEGYYHSPLFENLIDIILVGGENKRMQVHSSDLEPEHTQIWDLGKWNEKSIKD